MSIALAMRLAMAEKKAGEMIEKAKAEAQKIINNARTMEKEILSEDYIKKLTESLIEKYRQELASEVSKLELELDEEFERLMSISDEELNEIAEMLVKAIFK
ncbi:MAG: hypothetical protein QXJ52_01230 [Candidatus Korarchaeota archaeon]|nr:hypothetical protein [Thermoproteota archaeon]